MQCMNNDGDHDNIDGDHGDCQQDILWWESDKDLKRALDSSSVVERSNWQGSFPLLYDQCINNDGDHDNLDL